jgi:hypothetical protein
VKTIVLLPLLVFQAAAQPPADPTPKDVQTLIREAAEDLSNKDSTGFLNHFDPKMPGYETLHYEVEGLVARDAVISVIEIVTDVASDKDDRPQRELKLDWVLSVDTERPRREVVTVRIEKQGKKWRIVALEPVEFFKPTAAP